MHVHMHVSAWMQSPEVNLSVVAQVPSAWWRQGLSLRSGACGSF